MFLTNKRFEKIKIPSPGTMVSVVGKLQYVTDNQPCFITADLVLGPSLMGNSTPSDVQPSASRTEHFDWGTPSKRKQEDK